MLVAQDSLLLHLCGKRTLRFVPRCGAGGGKRRFAVCPAGSIVGGDDHDADLSVKSAQLLEGEFSDVYGEKVNVT